MSWTARMLTLFPEMFPGPLGLSLAGKALERGDWKIETIDIRGFATDKHRTVDDTPFGGGPGMVMRPDVVDAALDHAMRDGLKPAIYLTPRGKVLDQELVKELSAGPGVVILCGRYEGLDERVIEARGLMEVSLGDFVLSGGELPALALLDAVARLQPGVLGDAQSHEQDSFSDGLLDCPHYSRPEVLRDADGERAVPAALLSGHHAEIARWRRQRSLELTATRRPDLIAAARATGRLTAEDEAFLAGLQL